LMCGQFGKWLFHRQRLLAVASHHPKSNVRRQRFNHFDDLQH
jgi:hypothetical protein